jgi:NAD(P)H dehydrogenase (quinone)
MSKNSARREAMSHAAFNHWIAERVWEWSDLGVTNLRPTFFADWFLSNALGVAPGIKEGRVRLPFGDEGKHAPIAAEDQACVIATILEHPVAHRGKTYQLFGPKEYTFPEAFGKIAQILERPIEYERIPLDVYYEELMQWGRPFFAQHIVEVSKDHAAGVFSGTNDVIEHITGQKPMGLEEFIRQHRAAFA